MKNYELKLYTDNTIEPQTNQDIIKLIESKLETPLDGVRLKVNPKNKNFKGVLAEKFETSVRESISDGCYGARPGTESKGYTLWISPKFLIDRYVDEDKTEFVNPWHLLEEHGELVEDLDGEQFDQWIELLGLESKADNTYNFNGHSSDDASLMFDFQFTSVETPDNGLVVSIMFHCGGDPRGNYTNKHIWKFKYIEDFYSVISPSKYLTSEET